MTKQCERTTFDDYWGYEVEVYDAVFGSCELADTVNYIMGVAPMVGALAVAIATIYLIVAVERNS